MACKVELDDVLKEYGLTRDQLNTRCFPDVSKALAVKLDEWELLAPFIELSEQDCASIKEDISDYEAQSLACLTLWQQKLGNRATYLMLAESLEKIERLDLVRELYAFYKDTFATSNADNTRGATRPKDIIGEMISRFEIRFNDLAVTALKEVKNGNKASMEDFKIDLTLLPSNIRHDHLTFLQESLPSLTEALNLQEIFQHFNLYWDYFNYTLLEEIVSRYGNDSLKHQMKSYISDLHQFWQKTSIADFIPHCKKRNKFETIPEEFLQLKMKHELDKEISEHTLFELEELRCHFQLRYQLPDFAMILYELQEGSLEVTWLVAKELECLKKDLRRELSDKYEKETQRIVSISLGSECIQPMTSSEKEDYIEEVWEYEFQGEEYYGAVGPRDVLIISNETAEGPDVVQRKKGCLTQEDKDRLTSQGIPPDCWEDDVKMMEARYSKEKRLSVSIERDTTAEHILSTIDTLLKNTKKPGVAIHYIGPGRRNTGDWCFKDGFITFNDIITLYEKYFKGKKLLSITSDCSYSGQWVKQGMEYLDKCKVQPCGHSARAAKILLTVIASCRSHQIPHTLLYSARGEGNDKNSGLSWSKYNKYEICPDQHTRGYTCSTITCKEGATFEDPCSLPHDYTWHKKSEEKRVRLVSGKVAHGRQAWHYVLLVDDEEMIDMFNANAKNSDIIDVADYGQVLKSGWGQEPPDEVREWIKKKYPYY